MPSTVVHKLAVLRANALGDLVTALPALDALRAAFPGAEMVLLGAPLHEELFRSRPGPVDRVEVVPRMPGIRDREDGRDPPKDVEAFFKRMWSEEFDLAIQLHGGGRHSNPFVRALGARLTAGLRADDALPLDLWVPYVYYQPEVLRLLEVAELVGARPAGIRPTLAVTAADLEASRLALPEEVPPLVLLHPGASDARRRWAPERFAQVSDAMAGRGYRVALLGDGAEEEAVVAEVASAMRHDAVDLHGALSIPALIGTLARASLLVANDSGPMHLANAVGTPTVGIYWCGNLINAEPTTRSTNRPVLSWRLDCPVCGLDCTKARCEHRASFVDDIGTGQVLREAEALLASAPSPASGLPEEQAYA